MTEVISSFNAEESFVFDHQVKSPLKNYQFRIFKLKINIQSPYLLSVRAFKLYNLVNFYKGIF